MMDRDELFTTPRGKLDDLLAAARAVGDLLNQAEQNHGGLIGVDTLKAANELRLELARWPKPERKTP
jgi:hypothetical protein